MGVFKRIKSGISNPVGALAGIDTKKLVDDAQKANELQQQFNEKFLEVLEEIDKKQDLILKKLNKLLGEKK